MQNQQTEKSNTSGGRTIEKSAQIGEHLRVGERGGNACRRRVAVLHVMVMLLNLVEPNQSINQSIN